MAAQISNVPPNRNPLLLALYKSPTGAQLRSGVLHIHVATDFTEDDVADLVGVGYAECKGQKVMLTDVGSDLARDLQAQEPSDRTTPPEKIPELD